MNPKEANIRSSPLLICPAAAWVLPNLAKLWEHRELLYFLTWRDIKVRYKQTVLGAAWAVIQPLCMMLVFTIFFGHLVGVPSDGLPYPIFAFSALLPLFILLSLMTAMGVGFWLSALNAQYRDVRYMLPFLTQFWLFATPVVYPASLVSEQWRLLYGLNPMTGVVEGFRWALLGKTGGPDAMLVVSATVVLAAFIGGLYYFNRVGETLADVV